MDARPQRDVILGVGWRRETQVLDNEESGGDLLEVFFRPAT